MLDDCRLQQIVFENPADMGKMIGEMRSQIDGAEGSFVVFEGESEVPMNRVFLCVDPFSMDPNSKDIVAGFQKALLNELNSPGLVRERDEILSNLQILTARAVFELDPEWSIDGLDLKGLMKAMGLRFISENNLLNRIVDTIRLSARYGAYCLFTLVGTSSFLSITDYSSLLAHLRYLQIPVIMVESHMMDGFSRTRVFDQDFCEIDICGGDNYFLI